jgi:hypothetical protein
MGWEVEINRLGEAWDSKDHKTEAPTHRMDQVDKADQAEMWGPAETLQEKPLTLHCEHRCNNYLKSKLK